MTNSGIPDAAVFVVCVRILREETLGRWRASPLYPPHVYLCTNVYACRCVLYRCYYQFTSIGTVQYIY